MKIHMKLAVVAAFAAALPAFAQIKINDSLSVTGWTVGSYTYTSTKGAAGNPNTSTDSFNADAALLGATITPTKEVTGTVSFYYKPASEGGINGPATATFNPSEVTLLDAYVAYDCGNGLVVTAGKFLSVLGYESYYAISDNMITLANQQFLAPIPGYHEGVKADYTVDKTLTFGGSVVDSEYSNNLAATEGDGHLEHNFGLEGYITYTGVENLTLWFGAGYDSKGTPVNPFGLPAVSTHSVYVLDFWASYQINKQLTVAAEEIYKDGGKAPNAAATAVSTSNPNGLPTEKGSNWLVYAQYLFTDKLSAWAAFSGEDVSSATFGAGKSAVSVSGPKYWKASISPAYALTANLTVKAQYSYTKYSSFTAKDANYFGVQVGFKF
jgi:hypothetical protein